MKPWFTVRLGGLAVTFTVYKLFFKKTDFPKMLTIELQKAIM